MPEAVDLGLPSGTKWASMDYQSSNYIQSGCVNPDIYDQVYASLFGLGNIPYGYTENFYSHGDNGTMYYRSEYFHDNLENIENTIQSYVGDSWNIPMKEDFDELINNCTSSSISIEGVECTKFESNGNYIIIPNNDFYYLTKTRIYFCDDDCGSAGFILYTNKELTYEGLYHWSCCYPVEYHKYTCSCHVRLIK